MLKTISNSRKLEIIPNKISTGFFQRLSSEEGWVKISW